MNETKPLYLVVYNLYKINCNISLLQVHVNLKSSTICTRERQVANIFAILDIKFPFTCCELTQWSVLKFQNIMTSVALSRYCSISWQGFFQFPYWTKSNNFPITWFTVHWRLISTRTQYSLPYLIFSNFLFYEIWKWNSKISNRTFLRLL